MKIEKNIPIPLPSYRSKNVSVIMNMEHGDSVAFPDRSKALLFYSSLRRYLGTRPLVNGKATMRRLKNGTYRVWYDQENLERIFQPQTLGE
jgi:hypothetical protein